MIDKLLLRITFKPRIYAKPEHLWQSDAKFPRLTIKN